MSNLSTVDRIVGSRLQCRRSELGVARADLAGRLGLSEQSIEDFETGAIRIDAQTMLEMCKELRIDVGYFFEAWIRKERPPFSRRRIIELRQPAGKAASCGLFSSGRGDFANRNAADVGPPPKARSNGRPGGICGRPAFTFTAFALDTSPSAIAELEAVSKNPPVGIIMGSQSDWETMRHAAETLARSDIAL